MRKNFLIGNFLPAYGRSFGRIDRTPSTLEGLSAERLRTRFDERAARYLARKSEYAGVVQLGLVGALILTIGAFRLNIQFTESSSIPLSEQEVVQMEEIIQTQQIERPPPPPRPPVPVEVPDDVVLDDEDLEFDASLDMNAAITDVPPPPPAPVEEKAESEIFVTVEQMPEIIGGLQALKDLVEYPDIALKSGLEGTVVVRIVVDPTGTPTNPTILKSVHEILDNEALRAVMQLKFKPARQRNRAVSVYFSIPVVFKIR